MHKELFLATTTLGRGVTSQAIAMLAQMLDEPKSFGNQQVLCEAGSIVDRFFIVICGKLQLRRSNEEGRELILHTAQRGELVGNACAFGKSARWYGSVVAASDTQVFSINPGRMTEVMYCDARFGLNLMQFLAQQIDCLQELFVGTALHDVEWRLMRILVRFAQDESNISGKDPERGIIVRNIPSQTELAGLVGCSRESLSRTSTILQQRGLVVLRGSRRVIQLTPLFLNALNLTVQDFPTPAARSF